METQEQKAIKIVGTSYVLDRIQRIEAETLNTTIDELLIPVRCSYSEKLINEMYDYIILQKNLIEKLAAQVEFQEHPITPPTKFYPMSKSAKPRY